MSNSLMADRRHRPKLPPGRTRKTSGHHGVRSKSRKSKSRAVRMRRLRPEVVASLAHRRRRKRLCWKIVPTIAVEGQSAAVLRLMEIDENLIHANLSPAERPRMPPSGTALRAGAP
jgi:hypothetical protein